MAARHAPKQVRGRLNMGGYTSLHTATKRLHVEGARMRKHFCACETKEALYLWRRVELRASQRQRCVRRGWLWGRSCLPARCCSASELPSAGASPWKTRIYWKGDDRGNDEGDCRCEGDRGVSVVERKARNQRASGINNELEGEEEQAGNRESLAECRNTRQSEWEEGRRWMIERTPEGEAEQEGEVNWANENKDAQYQGVGKKKRETARNRGENSYRSHRLTVARAMLLVQKRDI
eukprot:6190563-Pleurochrysis_carterae.AAC.3